MWGLGATRLIMAHFPKSTYGEINQPNQIETPRGESKLDSSNDHRSSRKIAWAWRKASSLRLSYVAAALEKGGYQVEIYDNYY